MRQQGAIGWLKHDVTHRGITAFGLSFSLIAFYVLLYFGGQWGIPDVITPAARALGLGSKWTLYGALYTAAITLGGVYVTWKYKHNNYQIVRTSIVVLVQATLAFSVPLILKGFEQPEVYMSYLWPLKIEYFYPSTIKNWPIFFILWSILGSLLLVPILGVFFGKRWYCSWVCGCGGLANTAGDPFRHLSDKSEASWKFEKVSIHSVLIIALLLTGVVGASYLVEGNAPELKKTADTMQHWYGIIVISILSGVVGVGLYPIGGTRIWCRFACPMAAILGLVQKFGRYRITVKDNMCISCGMCSHYCEMGIDVRAYAQQNQDFTRAACVGCGLCEEVCPRGVLHLENKWDKDPQELTMSDLLSKSYKSHKREGEPQVKGMSW